jgi:hypothetical protein
MITTRELRISIDTPYDETPDVSWLDQTPKQLGSLEAAVANRRRRQAYDRGDWHLIGVRLTAEIALPNETITLMSPGLWGVESDSSADYVRDIARDEGEYLREDLEALGFAADEIEIAISEAVDQ